MTEDEAKKWAKNKKNQQDVIEKCVEKDTPSKERIAIFMAGIPGAGKTEFVRALTKTTGKNMLVIEHDQLVEHIDTYVPENYYKYRKAGSTLVTAVFDHALANGFPFIFDGTLSHENGLKNIQKSLKAGYKVIIVYVHQDMKAAWQLTKDRELVKKRSIEKTGFIETCTKITQSLRTIFDKFRDNLSFAFWVLKKNGEPTTKKAEVIFYEGDHRDDSDPPAKVEEVLDLKYNVKELE